MSLLTKRVGDRRVFAVEFEVDPHQQHAPSDWWGSLWLWVNGKCVGRSDHIEMVLVGIGTLVNAAIKTGSRISPLLSSKPAAGALDLVMWTIYGDDESHPELNTASRETLQQFEVLPQGDSFFDGWEAILIEEGNTERFIVRKQGETASEVSWELGRFKDTVLEARAEFQRLTKP